MIVLIVGFNAFDGNEYNPTEIIVENLQSKKLDHMKAVILPVEFDNSYNLLRQQINDYKPDYIILMGVNSQINNINIEKVAINYVHARIPDNKGLMPIDQIIDKNLNSAYFSTIDPIYVQTMLKSQKIGSNISYSAGTYVCNYVYFKTLAEAKAPTIFLHVPMYDADDLKLTEIANAIDMMALSLLQD